MILEIKKQGRYKENKYNITEHNLKKSVKAFSKGTPSKIYISKRMIQISPNNQYPIRINMRDIKDIEEIKIQKKSIIIQVILLQQLFISIIIPNFLFLVNIINFLGYILGIIGYFIMTQVIVYIIIINLLKLKGFWIKILLLNNTKYFISVFGSVSGFNTKILEQIYSFLKSSFLISEISN